MKIENSKSMIYLLLVLGCFIINSCENTTDPDEDGDHSAITAQVVIAHPADGTSVQEIVKIIAIMTDSARIEKLTLIIDGEEVQESTGIQSPHTFYWNTIALEDSSEHTIIILATTHDNNTILSEILTIIVDNSAARPTQINIKEIQYIDNTFVVSWEKNTDNDFESYTLYQASSPDMSEEFIIYTTTNNSDTSLAISTFQVDEAPYFRIEVSDTIGLKTTGSIRKAYYVEYIEDFEFIISKPPYEEVGTTGSYYKEVNNDWMIYAEKTSEYYYVDTFFDWYTNTDAYSGTYSITGQSSWDGIGDLWLYKHFAVHEGINITISVYARTAKTHNGTSTGPQVYAFHGKIQYPSHNSEEFIERDNFAWDSYEVSPWTKLSISHTPSQEYITVAIKVHDNWNSYPVYADYDHLTIRSD